jgi:hypothetical protein
MPAAFQRDRSAGGRGRLPALENDHDAREQHVFRVTPFDHPSAEGNEEFLVRFGVPGIHMPMAHRHARLVGRIGNVKLRQRRRGSQRHGKP